MTKSPCRNYPYQSSCLQRQQPLRSRLSIYILYLEIPLRILCIYSSKLFFLSTCKGSHLSEQSAPSVCVRNINLRVKWHEHTYWLHRLFYYDGTVATGELVLRFYDLPWRHPQCSLCECGTNETLVHETPKLRAKKRNIQPRLWICTLIAGDHVLLVAAQEANRVVNKFCLITHFVAGVWKMMVNCLIKVHNWKRGICAWEAKQQFLRLRDDR